jgi:hypothetical protein
VDDQGSDVASTLNELARKLRALEADLEATVTEPPAVAATPPAPTAPPPVDAQAPPVTPPLALPHEPLPPLSEGEPEQIVAEARQRISDLRSELDDLARTREQIARTAHDLLSEYNRTLNEPAPAPSPVAAPAPALSTPPIAQPLPPEHTIQQGAVAIDAGFFRDITSLSTFEQSIARVPGVVGVHVRAFTQGRAIIDAQLSHPIPLGAELARYAPLRFTVTDAGPAHLMLAISS